MTTLERESLMPVMGKRYASRSDVRLPMAMLGEDRARKNHGQTLSRLKSRGGLSPFEAICNLDDGGLYDRKPRAYEEEESDLARRVIEWHLDRLRENALTDAEIEELLR